MLATRDGRAAGRGARPARGLDAAAAVGPRRPPARAARCATRWPRLRPAPRHRVRRDRRPSALRARGIVVRYGDVVAVRGVDLDLRAGRGDRADGPQRLRQVVAAVGDAGLRATPGRTRARSTARTRRRSRPADARALVGLVPQTPADLLYLETVAPSSTRPTASPAASDAAPAGELLDRLAPGIRPPRQPARPLRGAAARARAGGPAARRARRWCCSTSRPAAWTTTPSTRSPRSSTGSRAEGRAVVICHPRRRVRRRRRRPRRRDGRGRDRRRRPDGRVVVASPAFAPQVAKILAPLPYLTVAQVGLALDRRRLSR